MIEQHATAGFQLLAESREHARAPITFRHNSDAAYVPIRQHPTSNGARLFFRRERELIEASGARPFLRQEIERKDRRLRVAEIRCSSHFVARQRPDDELSAFFTRPRDRFRRADLCGVVDTNAWTLRDRHLIKRGHEAITHADAGSCRASRQRQKQGHVRGNYASARLLANAEQLARNNFRCRMIRIPSAPRLDIRRRSLRATRNCCRERRELEPTAHDVVGYRARLNANAAFLRTSQVGEQLTAYSGAISRIREQLLARHFCAYTVCNSSGRERCLRLSAR